MLVIVSATDRFDYYCEDGALEIVEGLDEHGPLNGIESWRRLFSDQKGTLSQKANSLRDSVIYPERVRLVTDVVKSLTAWEKAYTDLVEASQGNFKLDDHGKIGALKRLMPLEIVSNMI